MFQTNIIKPATAVLIRNSLDQAQGQRNLGCSVWVEVQVHSFILLTIEWRGWRMQVSNLHVIVQRYKFHRSEMYQTDKERVTVCVGCMHVEGTWSWKCLCGKRHKYSSGPSTQFLACCLYFSITTVHVICWHLNSQC